MSLLANSAAFASLKPEQVPEDMRFYHAFFTEKKAREERDKAQRKAGDDDEEDLGTVATRARTHARTHNKARARFRSGLHVHLLSVIFLSLD